MEFAVVFFLSSKKRLVGYVFPMVGTFALKTTNIKTHFHQRMWLASSNLGSRKENKLNQII